LNAPILIRTILEQKCERVQDFDTVPRKQGWGKPTVLLSYKESTYGPLERKRLSEVYFSFF
jgi:hypothetical protein